MGEQMVSSTKFTWNISNFTELTENRYLSEVFTIGGNSWKLLFYPQGDVQDPYHFLLSLLVVDYADLPPRWTRSVNFSLILVNQINSALSIRRDANTVFCATLTHWGFEMLAVSELHRDGGLLLNNKLIIEAHFHVPEVTAEDQPTTSSKLESHFSNLEKLLSEIDVPAYCKILASDSLRPTLEEVEGAKQTLKECLTDLLKLNIVDRLFGALSTLNKAKVGLSACQESSIHEFLGNFEEFVSDFLLFEKYNSVFERQKLMTASMISEMRKNQQTHIQFKKFAEEITNEKEECRRKMEELQASKEKLKSDQDILLADSMEARSKFVKYEKKAKKAEEKKRIAEERMSRSTGAWSNLKRAFT